MKNKKRVNWKVIKIIMVNWTIFLLIMTSVALWLVNKEMQAKESELQACKTEWNEFKEMLDEGKLVIQLEKSDVFKEKQSK